MDTSKRPMQSFNGKDYYLYDGERYFSKSNKRLHVVKWEFYNGKVPKGFHVHHKDENPQNNDIENLELIEGKEHLREHGLKRAKENKAWYKNFAKQGREKAKEWHASKEGFEWHRQNAIKCNFGHLKFGKRECKVCKSEFEANTKFQEFCSRKCVSKNRRETGIDNVTRDCVICETEFTVNKYSIVSTCGRSCGTKLQHKRMGHNGKQ
jgi:hypothetical protein